MKNLPRSAEIRNTKKIKGAKTMSNKIYVECPNCGHDISVELGEHDKQIRTEMIKECTRILYNTEHSRSMESAEYINKVAAKFEKLKEC